MKLDGKSRIDLISPQSSGDLQQPPHMIFQFLFRDNAKREEVRRIIKDAFGSYFVIDPTNIGFFRIRLSRRPPVDELEERGLHEAAVQFHAAAQPIELASDGVKAFTGIITEVIAGDPKILLIDEPEAFLHPSLAFNLGYELSRAALNTDKRVFVSTHSPTFVMGCIQSGAPVNIVRLTYRDGVATARVLPSADLLRLMRNPLLRSTGVLSVLFYEFVVVTESDTDRAFYQEINERLLRFKPEWGIPNCLFLHAQNKQTVQIIMRPLRELGIPTAAIVDIDVLKEGGAPWANLLSASSIPPITHPSLATLRTSVMQAFTSSGKNMKRDGGVEALVGAEREATQNLLQSLAEYGVFVVPGGELESWVKALGVGGHGPGWLIPVFESMGEDPESPSFLRPGNDDVWAFLGSVRSWLMDPNRKGIPA
ncbi:ATP-dependent endonuclease [Bosea sp. BIWAKO-01]|uniref:ATP-dependent nuclease n=1 Tax=Bosea sp. BIWAKO-01 TaxID=506668 RepID=UPI00191C86B6|nr:AAA family ATPase [Bosea sp. BIWAKO-01]